MKKITLLLIFVLLVPGCAGFSNNMRQKDESVSNWFVRSGKRMNQLYEKIQKVIDL